jgi:hypothetical protein
MTTFLAMVVARRPGELRDGAMAVIGVERSLGSNVERAGGERRRQPGF